MLIDCPLTGLQYYKEKVSTACSCVKVKCLTGEVPGPFNNHGIRQGPVHVQEIRPKSIVKINPGFFWKSEDCVADCDIYLYNVSPMCIRFVLLFLWYEYVNMSEYVNKCIS